MSTAASRKFSAIDTFLHEYHRLNASLFLVCAGSENVNQQRLSKFRCSRQRAADKSRLFFGAQEHHRTVLRVAINKSTLMSFVFYERGVTFKAIMYSIHFLI